MSACCNLLHAPLTSNLKQTQAIRHYRVLKQQLFCLYKMEHKDPKVKTRVGKGTKCW